MDVSNKIREARKAAGLTQKGLAEKAGLATITIQQYESNKRQPRLDQGLRKWYNKYHKGRLPLQWRSSPI